ncbi:hypothetical protein LG204_09425 [Methylovorus menthalis]|uniref:hypothetical protein n=1 Tax=Methylovorus menthalis TaxID=1002227 RepID=UPI001E2CDF7D|nr:hypothetical protein [Methylovorus menthalis]MCB4811537.1 hypothetical protein [Methylovorus menthalis]
MSLTHSLDALQSLLASQLPCPVISGRPEQSLGLYLFPWHIYQPRELRNINVSAFAQRPCSLSVVLLPKADSVATSLDLLDQAMTTIQAQPIQTTVDGTVQIILDAWSADTMMQFFTAAALPLQSALACELRTV